MTSVSPNILNSFDFVNGRIVLPDEFERICYLDQLEIKFNLKTDFGKLCAFAYWRHYGIVVYQSLNFEMTNAFMEAILKPARESDVKLSAFPQFYQSIRFLPRYLLAIYTLRDDLREAYPPESDKSPLGLLGWFIRYGNEFKLPDWLFRKLNAPSPTLPNAKVDGITLFMESVWISRPDLQKLYPLMDNTGRKGFLGWYIQYGVKEVEGFDLPAWLVNRLGSPSSTIPNAKEDGITLLMEAVWACRFDLQEIYPLKDLSGRTGFIEWFTQYGSKEILPVVQSKTSQREMEGNDGNRKSSNKIVSDKTVNTAAVMDTIVSPKSDSYSRKGVQILGWVKGELGMGEDVRMASLALESIQIPHIILNTSRNLTSRENDLTYANRIKSNPEFYTNITYMAPSDHYKYFLGSDRKLWSNRYNIGSWPWELPNWPERLDFVFDIVDEVWAPTQFIANAYKAVGKKPVTLVPMTVNIDEVNGDLKGEFGIVQDDFVFLFNYDTLSSPSRKNPTGVVESFKLAFPNTTGVRLIIKTMNARFGRSHWDEMINKYSDDERIIFIDEVYPKEKSLRLTNTCDVFVSLHRAEGFGRNIAEAMLLGKAVITSDFSGNTDFCNHLTSFLVNGEVRELKPREYTYFQHQYWFEPDLYHAADQLKVAFFQRDITRERSMQGRKFIKENYNPKRIGELYLKHFLSKGLLEIGN